jgi:hypothetical protein
MVLEYALHLLLAMVGVFPGGSLTVYVIETAMVCESPIATYDVDVTFIVEFIHGDPAGQYAGVGTTHYVIINQSPSIYPGVGPGVVSGVGVDLELFDHFDVERTNGVNGPYCFNVVAT